MKRIIVFFMLLISISNKVNAGEQRQLTDEEIDEMYGKCEDMIISMKEFEGTLGKVFADQRNASRVIWCFSDKIKQNSTPQQFELYEKAKAQAEEFLNALLYYKGYLTIYTERSELMYRYQSFIYHALTGDKNFILPEPDKIDCQLNDKITEVPMCLKQDVLKICNIESRRNVQYYLNNLTQTTLKLLETITDDENILKKQIQQYYNMIFHFVVLIRGSYLMNPLDSWMYMGDVYLYEEMNGLEHLEAEEMKEPYPLPFP